MPKTSRESAAVEHHGPVTDRHAELDGYTVNIVSFDQDIDATPLLKGLPDDACPAPTGLRARGRVTFRFPDRDDVEVFEAGDAFYLPAGHIPSVDAGTEYVQFSPTEPSRPVVCLACTRAPRE